MRLSTKVLLALTIVIAVALITASLLIGRTTGNAYRVYLRGYQQQELARLAESAGQVYAETGSWAEVQRWLDENGQTWAQPGSASAMRGQGRGQRRQGQQAAGPVLVVDAESGKPLAPSAASVAGDAAMAMAPILVDGVTVAALATEPTNVQLGAAEATLLNQVNQAILLSALAAGAVALGVGWLLLASILRPLRSLSRGVAQVADGDLSARVDLAGKDEIAQLALNFNRMAASLQAQEELRQRLVSDIAHELRTPLSVIQGNLQAILDGVYPLTVDEVRTVHEETHLISRLVTDLHELAQAEAGRLPLVRQPVNVNEVLGHMAASFRPMADGKKVALDLVLADRTLLVDADPDRLQQILTNLVGNALRHTPEQGWVRMAAQQLNGRVQFTVSNSGPGIAAVDLPHVFDRFYRGDDSRTRQDAHTSGTGLGLAIVKALAEAHGGSVGAESSTAETIFWFSLPSAAGSKHS